MNREFIINIFFLILINLLIKPFYLFGIDRVVQNEVAQGEYGLYFALFNFTYLFQIINDFGLQNYNNRNIAMHPELLDKTFPSILLLKLGLGGIFLLLITVGFELLHFPTEQMPLLWAIGLNWILLSMILFLRSNISGLGMYRLDSLLSVLDKFLLIIIAGILLWTPILPRPFKIEWFVYAQSFSLFLTATIIFFLIFKRLNSFRLRIDYTLLKKLLLESLPYALAVFLMTVYFRIDGVMIERMLPDGKEEAALYASAYRLLDTANIFGFLFAGLLLPMFSSMLKNKENILPLLGLSFRLIWAGAVILAISCFFYRAEIMVALYDTGSAYSGEIFGVLILSFIALSGSYIYGTLLVAKGILKKMNYVFATGLVLNFALNYYLIPTHKAYGAAFATLITQIFILVADIVLAIKELQLYVFPRWVISVISFTGVILILVWGINLYIGGQWFVKFLLSILAGGIVAFLFRLVSFSEIKKLLKSG